MSTFFYRAQTSRPKTGELCMMHCKTQNARLGTFSTQEKMYVMKMQQILQILEVLTVH